MSRAEENAVWHEKFSICRHFMGVLLRKASKLVFCLAGVLRDGANLKHFYANSFEMLENAI